MSKNATPDGPSLDVHSSGHPRVAIVGGGLAALATAAALCQQGCRVELFEARRQLGGRAGSFCDPATGEIIDHCQHVSMGCCTNLADFCRRTQVEHLFRRDAVLHFFGPDGIRYDVQAVPWLPAPLHLAPSLLRLKYLTWAQRIGVARGLWQLARVRHSNLTMHDWLVRAGQSPQAIDYFWSVVLTSALGETVDQVSVLVARKVFIDGFLMHPQAHEIIIPRVPLGELYGQHVRKWLEDHGVTIHLGVPVARIEVDGMRARGIALSDGTRREFDYVIVAVPWRRAGELFDSEVMAAWPALARLDQIAASPITAAHLWFDRSIMSLPHAVLIGRLSQWIFAKLEVGNRNSEHGIASNSDSYYQVVISGSRDLHGRERESIIRQIQQELESVFPAARTAQLVRWRLVTDPVAVFSVRPGLERLRPAQRTPIANLMLAGDWTDTQWPATMEGAVRSGYLAAEQVLKEIGRPRRIVAPDLPAGGLARLFIAR